MINLPDTLTPSQLLCCEGLTPFIDEVLKGSRSRHVQGDWVEGELSILETIEASRTTYDCINRAAALIYRGDIRRETRRLGPALRYYQEAYRVFQHQPCELQQHNAAVAAYALGMTHHLLGSDLEALKWYHDSEGLFCRAKERWIDDNALRQVDSCTRVQRWIRALSDFLTAILIGRGMEFPSRIWVPIFLAQADASAVERLVIEESDQELEPRLDSFEVRPLADRWRPSLDRHRAYDAQEIPRGARWVLDADRQDHALVEWGDSIDQAGIDETVEVVQSDVGRFVRDDSGRVFVIRPGPRVIGGEDHSDKLQTGYIPALLKPK